jgi:hypothetical protein
VLVAAMVALIALGAPADGSAAKAAPVKQQASVSVEVHGKAGDGFSFNYFSFDARQSFLLLTKRVSQTGDESVNYVIKEPAVVDGKRLDVKIGGLGHFRGRFVATSTKSEAPEKGCTGDPTIVEKGVFVGSFSFHGERGYTTIGSHRERGAVTRQGAMSCKSQAPAGKGRRHRSTRPTKAQRQAEKGQFSLIAGTPDVRLLFQAQREESPEPEEGPPTTFLASVDSRTGPLRVIRAATLFDIGPEDGAAFLTPNATEPLAEATLTPPAPFSGSATFHLENPHTASWTGDLAVELPGLGTVPLTGGAIEAAMCKSSTICTKTVSGTLKKVLEFTGAGDGSFYGGKATTEPAS